MKNAYTYYVYAAVVHTNRKRMIYLYIFLIQIKLNCETHFIIYWWLNENEIRQELSYNNTQTKRKIICLCYSFLSIFACFTYCTLYSKVNTYMCECYTTNIRLYHYRYEKKGTAFGSFAYNYNFFSSFSLYF